MAEDYNRFLQDTDKGTTTPLEPIPFLIGFDEHGALVPGKAGVTTLAAITLSGGEAVAEALSPAHPVRVNGNPVQKMILLDGDAMEMAGTTWLMVKARPQPVRDEDDPDRTLVFGEARSGSDEPPPPTISMQVEPGKPQPAKPPAAPRPPRRIARWLIAAVIVIALLLVLSLLRRQERVVEVAVQPPPSAPVTKPVMPPPAPVPEIPPMSAADSQSWLDAVLAAYRGGDAPAALDTLRAPPALAPELAAKLPEWSERIAYLFDLFETGRKANADGAFADADQAWIALDDLESQWLGAPPSTYLAEARASRAAREPPPAQVAKMPAMKAKPKPVAKAAAQDQPAAAPVAAPATMPEPQTAPVATIQPTTACAGVASPSTAAEREAEAQCLFRLGYRLEDANRAQARHYYEQAVAIAPGGSSYARNARARLDLMGNTR